MYKCNRCGKVATLRSSLWCSKCQPVDEHYPNQRIINTQDSYSYSSTTESTPSIESSPSIDYSGGGGAFGGGGASGSLDSCTDSGTSGDSSSDSGGPCGSD